MNEKNITMLVDIQGYLVKGNWLEVEEVRLYYSALCGHLLYVGKEPPRSFPDLSEALTAFLKESGALKQLSSQEK